MLLVRLMNFADIFFHRNYLCSLLLLSVCSLSLLFLSFISPPAASTHFYLHANGSIEMRGMASMNKVGRNSRKGVTQRKLLCHTLDFL